MFTTIITDCKGENEKARQITRCNSLSLGPTALIGVDSGLGEIATIEAAGNLIDVLDAGEGKKGVVIVNVAPRGTKNDYNGSLFCYFNYKNTLIISTVGGYSLSLIKKLGVVQEVNLLETQKVLNFSADKKLITKEHAEYIKNTQFRSFDFAPRVAKWLLDKHSLPHKPYSLHTIPDVQTCVWCIDAFGNCKLTLLGKNLPLKVKTNIGTFQVYERLKDIPTGETAIYTGSSGLEDKRFLEIATQAKPGSAAKKLNLKVGSKIKFH